jgi:tetratricopeptide (TPR) repeat protein
MRRRDRHGRLRELAEQAGPYVPAAVRTIRRLGEVERYMLEARYSAEYLPGYFDDPEYRWPLVKMLHQLGDVHVDRGENVAAATVFNLVYQLLTEVPDRTRREEELLARAVYDLAVQMHDFDPDAAVTAAREALTRTRSLHGADPDRRQNEQLSLALGYLGLIHAELGRTAAAVEMTSEAVLVLRHLAEQPDREAAVRLAAELGHLGHQLGMQRRHEEAFQALDESLASFRRLQPEPEKFRAQFARTLLVTGRLLLDRGRVAECLPVAEEGVEVCRGLMNTPVDATLNALTQGMRLFDRQGRLAAALELYSDVLTAMGSTEDAANAAGEARSLRPDTT